MNKRIILTMTAALIVGAGISSQAADATTLTLQQGR